MNGESVPLNGIEMYYETEGSGEPLLLLHGGTGCQENWTHAGREQFALEYRLIHEFHSTGFIQNQALSRIKASTLIVYGDRDPLYPVEMAIEMYRAIPRSALRVAPNGGHGPVFFGAATQFAQTALAFLRTPG